MGALPFVSIIIPAYNEAGNIAWVVREALETLQKTTDRYEIIVIDDASQDTTPDILARLQPEIPSLQIIRNPQNIGCHPSTLVGFQAAQGEYQFFIPGDGQIPAQELTQFLEKAQSGCEVVYSWRVQRADPWHRRLISGCYNVLLRTFFGIPVHDADSACLLTQKAVQQILPQLHADSAFLTVEILLKAQQLNLPIGEVVIDHRPRTAGVAKGINVKDLSKVPFQFLTMLWWFWQQKRHTVQQREERTHGG